MKTYIQRLFYFSDPTKQKWINHKGVQRLEEVLNLKETCGYITFVNTGVPDIGCDQYDLDVHLVKPKRSSTKARRSSQTPATVVQPPNTDYIVSFQFNFNEFLISMSKTNF